MSQSKFIVPVNWNMANNVEIKANLIEEAMDKLEKSNLVPCLPCSSNCKKGIDKEIVF